MDMKINAEAHNDDHVFEVPFDAFGWFEQPTDAEGRALAAYGWGGDCC